MSASELRRPSDCRLSAKLVPTFADRECRVVSATDSHGRILGFLDRSRYFPTHVAPQWSSRGWVDSVPEPLLHRKSGSARNRTRDIYICSQEHWPLDHRGGLYLNETCFHSLNAAGCWNIILRKVFWLKSCRGTWNTHFMSSILLSKSRSCRGN
jgi:hypothetical protein